MPDTSFTRASAPATAFARLALLSILSIACVSAEQSAETDAAPLASIRSDRRALQLALRDSTLGIGDTASILVNGSVQNISGRTIGIAVKFRSSDTTILNVTAAGLVQARRTGSATITGRSVIASGAVEIAVADVAIATPPVITQQAPPALSDGIAPFVVPELPSAQVLVTAPVSGSRVVRVPAGNVVALQTALDGARSGDEIVLPDGATFSGDITLRNRSDDGVVILRSETVPVAFGTRITPARSGNLATLVATSVSAAISTEPGAHGWRIVGVRVRLGDQTTDNYGIVTIGSGTESAAGQFARDIVLDRVLIDGGERGNTSRCLSLNGIRLALVDSWLANCHALGRDAQAVGSWTGTGPFLISNNHLEGSGQAIMFGGADPLVAGVTPSDITIRRNHLFKPLSWAMGRWTVKAAFELKHAKRVLFEGNVIENHWADAQTGFAILFQAASQDSRAPWTVIQDVTVRHNVIQNSRSGINLLSRIPMSGGAALAPSRRILFRDNAFVSTGRDPVSGLPGRYLQLLGDLQDATIAQNTFFGEGASNDVLFDGDPMARLTLSNNVFSASTYGIIGTAMAEGSATLARFAPGAVVIGNLLTALNPARYPEGNLFPASLTTADFIDFASGNLTLRSDKVGSALGSSRIGADGSAILSAIAGATAR